MILSFVCAGISTSVAAQAFVPDDIVLQPDGGEQPLQAAAVEEPLPEPASEPLPDPFKDENAPASVLKPRLLPPVEAPCVETPVVETPVGDDRLTLSEAEMLATSYHPAMREAASQVRAARGNWVQVGLRPNPEIGYLGQEIGNEDSAGLQGGFVRKEFVTAGKLGANRAVASREIAMAEQRVETARLQILTTVRMYYFDVLAAERTLELSRQLNQISGESVRVSELRLKAMDIPRFSLLQSQIERQSAALLEVEATQRHEAAWRRLAAVIGVSDTKPPVLEDTFQRSLPELDWEAMRERLLAESPELSELRFEVDRARAAVRQATVGRVPNVSAEAGVQRDDATEYTIANVEVSVPIPIFNRNQGAIAQAGGRLAAAQAALEEGELAVEQRLAAAMRDYTTARQQATQYAAQVLPVARESLDMINAGYQQGELDYLDVLSIQRTYAEKNLSYLEDLEQAWKRWAEIDGLLVGPLRNVASRGLP
jgi:cobalt-zinc-cadmium efflux system outer membrane protein